MTVGGRGGGVPMLHAEDDESVRSELARDVTVSDDARQRQMNTLHIYPRRRKCMRVPVCHSTHCGQAYVVRLAPRPCENRIHGNFSSIGGASGCACKLVPFSKRFKAQPSRGIVMKSAKPPTDE